MVAYISQEHNLVMIGSGTDSVLWCACLPTMKGQTDE